MRELADRLERDCDEALKVVVDGVAPPAPAPAPAPRAAHSR